MYSGLLLYLGIVFLEVGDGSERARFRPRRHKYFGVVQGKIANDFLADAGVSTSDNGDLCRRTK